MKSVRRTRPRGSGGTPQRGMLDNIRKFLPADEANVVAVWHRSRVAAFTFRPTWQTFTLEQSRWIFDRIIRPSCAIWIATLDERVVAYLAMKRSRGWLIALMVLCCDPLAIALIAATSAGRSITVSTLVRTTLHSCRVDAIEGHSG